MAVVEKKLNYVITLYYTMKEKENRRVENRKKERLLFIFSLWFKAEKGVKPYTNEKYTNYRLKLADKINSS